jgi:hypothetical protein
VVFLYHDELMYNYSTKVELFGIAKKGLVMFVVLVASLLDLAIGTDTAMFLVCPRKLDQFQS